MKEFKGTPGPWEVAGICYAAVGVEFDNNSYKPICLRPERTGGKLTDEYNSNMRLIAAAPELLEALQWAMGRIGKYSNRATTNTDYCDSVDFAYAAIAKALGEAK